ncbi:von Willebrand factor type A domain protein [Roseobacter sp. SK209-2-6]|uniref:VWA domain-containing protein n=1 Tax=Roseobacter sp. SK209-2-6 TaxID=388739 RepID=UPI0000F3C5CE|nr:VWA domain-containing protein [Roseobacter sp. SK209-2-6]EBA18745.1 von Willebrand factor type A domain protein [Roseobacter sp. SK209-2-6]
MLKKLMIATLLAGVSAPLAANETTRSTFVLDASGSMWGQIEGVAKITIAQQVLQKLLVDLSPNQEVGLMAYGHRQKGDCSDIEQLIAPAAGTREAISKAVDAITPKGKTPLSAAVIQAAEGLHLSEEKATVILISDGEETCGRDPCAIGAELEAAGVDFTLHAIGFGIADDAARAQLQCLAENTGGVYLDAKGAEGLSAALSHVTKAATGPEAAAAKATLTGPAKARAGQVIEIAWQGPGEAGDWIGTLAPNADVGAFSSRIGIDHGNPAPLPVPPQEGPYDLVYVQAETGEVLARQPLEVTPMVASISAPASGTTGSSVLVNWQGRGSEKDFVGIAPKAEGFPATSFYFETIGAAQQSLRMPSHPGDYEIVYIATTDPWTVLARTPISLSDPKLKLKAPASVSAGVEFGVLWTGLVPNPSDYIALAKPDDPLPHLSGYAATDSHFIRLTAPDEPGQYELRFFYAEADRIVATRSLSVE